MARGNRHLPSPLRQAGTLILLTVSLVAAGCLQPAAAAPKNELRLHASALPQRPGWIDTVPAPADGHHFLVGLSEHHASERDAREEAMGDARAQFARYTGVEIALVDEVVRSLYGSSSEVLDPFVDSLQKSTQTTDAEISRIKARQWYWESYRHFRNGEEIGLVYRCWVLVAVPDDEYGRVQAWKRTREEKQQAEARARTAMIRELVQGDATRGAGAEEAAVVAKVSILPSVLTAARRDGIEAALHAVRDNIDTRLMTALPKMLPLPIRGAPIAFRTGRDDLTAADLASLRTTGARFLFLPRIDAFADTTQTTEFSRISRITHERQLFLGAALDVVDLVSGEVLPASSALQFTRSERSGMLLPGTAVALEKVPAAAAAEMARELARLSAAALRPPRILAISGEQVLIDRGAAFGFSPGETVEIYAAGPAGSTSRDFRQEYPVGRARIVRAEEEQCHARLLDPNPLVAPGFVVRPLPPATKEAEADGLLTPGSSDRPVNW